MGRERIIGEDVTFGLTYNGALTTLNVVQAMDFSINTKTLEEGYLGESVNRYDDILEGFSGKVTLHLDSEEAFIVSQAIFQRAQARDPSIKFNITMRATFPNGQTPRVILSDLFFDAIPFNVPKRDEYVNIELSFKCSNFTLLA